MDTNTATSLRGVTDFFRAQYVDPAGQEASTAGQTSALSAAQLAAYKQILADFNSGLAAARNELGTTALSLPDVESAADMGALSTADLLQLLRSEARKTTALLVNTTLEGIAAQEATIAANGVKTDAELEEADNAIKEAQKLQEILNVVKWVVVGLSFLAAIATGGVAGLAMAGLMAALLVMSEVDVKDDQSTIDLFTGWISSELQANNGMDEAEADKAAMYIVLAIQLVLTFGAAYYAATSGAVKGASDVAKASADVAVKTATAAADDVTASAVSSAAQATDDMAVAAAKNAASIADDVGVSVVDDVAVSVGDDVAVSVGDDAAASVVDDAAASGADDAAQQATKIDRLKSAVQISTRTTEVLKAGGDGYVGYKNYEAGMANAEVEALKAMLAYLQSILQNDADFIQQLIDIQAQLDGGVAEIVNNEFRANENRTGQMYS